MVRIACSAAVFGTTEYGWLPVRPLKGARQPLSGTLYAASTHTMPCPPIQRRRRRIASAPASPRVISNRRTASGTPSCDRISGTRSASRGGGWRTSDRSAVTLDSARTKTASVSQLGRAAAGASTASNPASRAAQAMFWVVAQSSDTRSASSTPRSDRVALSVRSRMTRSTDARPTRRRTSNGSTPSSTK